jgi:hypothetical protein
MARRIMVIAAARSGDWEGGADMDGLGPNGVKLIQTYRFLPVAETVLHA